MSYEQVNVGICEARSSVAPELVADHDVAGLLVADQMNAVLVEVSQGAEYGSLEYEMSRLAGLGEIITIEDDKAELSEDIGGDDILYVAALAEMTRDSIDCSGCSYGTQCQVETIHDSLERAISERLQMKPVIELLNKAPAWMRGAWLHHADENGVTVSQQTRQKISTAGKIGHISDADSKQIAELVYLPQLEITESGLTRASDVVTLQDVSGLREDQQVDVVVMQAPNHRVRIIDARPAVVANNSQSPNGNDVNAMLCNLLERAPKTVSNDNAGHNVVPALSSGKMKSGFSPIVGYKGVGSMYEFRMWGEGSKSRLYGVSLFDHDGRLVEFSIIGATSGNGNDAQDRFLSAIL
jgi:hypothetical protein